VRPDPECLGLHQVVTLRFIRSGKLIENAYAESFNGRFPHECLNEQFVSNTDAKTTIEPRRIDYDTARPHSALDKPR
jgi:putative transposase